MRESKRDSVYILRRGEREKDRESKVVAIGTDNDLLYVRKSGARLT